MNLWHLLPAIIFAANFTGMVLLPLIIVRRLAYKQMTYDPRNMCNCYHADEG